MTPYEFFLENAGFSYDPRVETADQGRERCAQAMADAERHASDAGWSFQWEIDQYGDSSEWDTRPRAIARADAYAVWCCVLRDDAGEVLASLCGVDFGRDGSPWGEPYRRVVEAELALEGMPS